MKPNDVDLDNEQNLLNTVYKYKRILKHTPHRRRRAKFKVGMHVRISEYRYIFDKSYTRNWSTELFKIKKVLYGTDPITYSLTALNGEEIKGCFYAEELQHAKHPDIYLVNEIIRKRKGQSYVNWLGFGSEHNSWVPNKSII